jgi:FMN-dependent NADH-azoreductase
VIVARKTFYYNKYGLPVGMLKGKKVQMIFTQGSPRFVFKNHIASAKKNFKQMGMKVIPTIHIASLKTPENIKKTIEARMKKHISKINTRAKKF